MPKIPQEILEGMSHAEFYRMVCKKALEEQIKSYCQKYSLTEEEFYVIAARNLMKLHPKDGRPKNGRPREGSNFSVRLQNVEIEMQRRCG